MSVATTLAGGGASSGGGGGSGDVTGPASSTDNAIARYDGTGGKTLQSSGVSISDAGSITGNIITITTRTVDAPISSSSAGSIFINTGASGPVELSLPPASPGLHYGGAIHAAQELAFRAAGTDVIYDGSSASSAGGALASSTVGSRTQLICTRTGFWTAVSSGTWAVT